MRIITRTVSRSRALLQAEDAGSMLLGQLEDAAASPRNTGERIVRHHDRKAGLFHEKLVHVPEQRAAARQHDPALGNVRAELGRRLLERLFDGADDALQGLL